MIIEIQPVRFIVESCARICRIASLHDDIHSEEYMQRVEKCCNILLIGGKSGEKNLVGCRWFVKMIIYLFRSIMCSLVVVIKWVQNRKRELVLHGIAS